MTYSKSAWVLVACFVLTVSNLFAQKVSGHVYIAESDRTVTWNVAGTDQEPISTSSVNIKMSVDGGQTYPYLSLIHI